MEGDGSRAARRCFDTSSRTDPSSRGWEARTWSALVSLFSHLEARRNCRLELTFVLKKSRTTSSPAANPYCSITVEMPSESSPLGVPVRPSPLYGKHGDGPGQYRPFVGLESRNETTDLIRAFWYVHRSAHARSFSMSHEILRRLDCESWSEKCGSASELAPGLD